MVPVVFGDVGVYVVILYLSVIILLAGAEATGNSNSRGSCYHFKQLKKNIEIPVPKREKFRYA